MSQGGRKKKSVIRTFRIDEDALEIIEKDAQEKKISANTLVNQLLLAYANFDRYMEQFPMIKISTNVFNTLLDGVSDEFAKDAGRRLAQNSILTSRMWRGLPNLSNLIDLFRITSDYSKVFTFRETEMEGKRIVTLQHRFGRKGSLYFGEFLLGSFALIDMQPRLTTTENAVSAIF